MCRRGGVNKQIRGSRNLTKNRRIKVQIEGVILKKKAKATETRKTVPRNVQAGHGETAIVKTSGDHDRQNGIRKGSCCKL